MNCVFQNTVFTKHNASIRTFLLRISQTLTIQIDFFQVLILIKSSESPKGEKQDINPFI